MKSNVAKFSQMLSNVVNYCQILPNIVKYGQMMSNMKKNLQNIDEELAISTQLIDTLRIFVKTCNA